MPVVVTGAGGMVARRLLPRLVAAGSEIRALVRRPEQVEVIRVAAPGTKVAVADLSDVENLAWALHDAHTVVHLAGGLDQLTTEAYETSNLRTAEWTLEAAERAKVRRFLFLSYTGASRAATNPYLRAKGQAEEAVANSGLDWLVLRSTHVYGQGSAWLDAMVGLARRRPALVVGPGTQRLAPVFVDDVAAALAAADDREAPLTGTYAIAGPDEISADDLTDRLAARRARKVHLSPRVAARLSRLARRPASVTLIEVMAADSLPDAPDARTPL
ncbi:MAG TPA: NAD(P)H-binding protein, partial [Actinomycetota bacterium]|nr:NAD(P)H-binding protein [Actinomycetota bacterium]